MNEEFCRTIDPKPCNPRTLQKPKKGGGYPKVFLGGLPSNVTETDLRTFFARFGKVMEVVIMYDQEKKKSRGWFKITICLRLLLTCFFLCPKGFGFLSFEDDDAVDRCVSEHFVNLNGKQVRIFFLKCRLDRKKIGKHFFFYEKVRHSCKHIFNI